jgi:Tfp pilus assembly protein PilF
VRSHAVTSQNSARFSPDHRVSFDNHYRSRSSEFCSYGILFTGRVDDAIQVFKLEVQEYPKYWNAHDILGEAYMDAKQNDLAIQNYEMSITLKPDNQNGINMLKKLKQQKQP